MKIVPELPESRAGNRVTCTKGSWDGARQQPKFVSTGGLERQVERSRVVATCGRALLERRGRHGVWASRRRQRTPPRQPRRRRRRVLLAVGGPGTYGGCAGAPTILQLCLSD